MKDKSIKILAIGNSFSVDGMEYLWDILNDAGYDNIILGNLAIGGCTVDIHADNIKSNSPSYLYGKNTGGVWNWSEGRYILDGLLDEEWDIVTLQQASGFSGRGESYRRKNEIISYILSNIKNPNVKIYWHLTWAYDKDSPHIHFDFYNKDQDIMYNAILNAVKKEILTDKSFFGVIPSGIAVQNLRGYIGDNVTRDSFHLSESHGRFTAALTWAKALCDIDIDFVNWLPPRFADEIKPHISDIKKSVNDAVSYRFFK